MPKRCASVGAIENTTAVLEDQVDAFAVHDTTEQISAVGEAVPRLSPGLASYRLTRAGTPLNTPPCGRLIGIVPAC
jgi:hypothetical protein